MWEFAAWCSGDMHALFRLTRICFYCCGLLFGSRCCESISHLLSYASVWWCCLQRPADACIAKTTTAPAKQTATTTAKTTTVTATTTTTTLAVTTTTTAPAKQTGTPPEGLAGVCVVRPWERRDVVTVGESLRSREACMIMMIRPCVCVYG